MPRPVVIPFFPFQLGRREIVTPVRSFWPVSSGTGFVARVGGCSRLSPEDSSMMLSREARELSCDLERVCGSRRVGDEGEESGEA